MYMVISDGGNAFKLPCGIDEQPEYDCPSPGILTPFDICPKNRIALFAERTDAMNAIRIAHDYNRLWYPADGQEPYKIVRAEVVREEE